VLRNLLARDPASAGYMFGTTELLAQSHVVIDDIWMFDEAMHAASADLNAGLLGTAEIWTDLGRDIVNFALHVLPTAKAAGSSAPWQLEWAPVGAAPAVKIYGFGASFGGASQAIAAHYHPEVFEGVLLVDGMVAPRVHPLAKFRKEGLGPFFRARDALKRRDTWPSREDARKLMEQVEFYQRWDREIFELWISHGLVPVDYARPDGEVTLATSPWCEAVVFSEPYEAPRGWDLLPSIRVPVGFLMAHDAERTLGDAITQELVWRPPLARNERATDADHLIVQESPTTVADSAWRFLQTLSAGQWGSGPEEIRASYGSRSLGAKL
jgi:pimeloyl-ACP methyl ester carboxylesterase